MHCLGAQSTDYAQLGAQFKDNAQFRYSAHFMHNLCIVRSLQIMRNWVRNLR
jgi:hypothetical protein